MKAMALIVASSVTMIGFFVYASIVLYMKIASASRLLCMNELLEDSYDLLRIMTALAFFT